MQNHLLFFMLWVLIQTGLVSCNQYTKHEKSVKTQESPPNILVIIADDLGYSDLGSYGGEVDTPNIDRLAYQGLRFSNFNVNPMCEVTRASLITGHTPKQSFEYQHSIPIAKMMQKGGYHTFLSGKWHQPFTPIDAGFENFYGFLGGQIDSWTGIEGQKAQIQTQNDAPQPVPDDWYSTAAFTDYAISSIDKSLKAKQPFFGFVAYNAPHSPLHAPRKNVEKYAQRYLAGWQKLRQDRFSRLNKLGMIDHRYVLAAHNVDVRVWDEIDPISQRIEALRMAAYAGMVDALDEHIGRLIDHLSAIDELDNTFIVFMSDNGGDYSNGDINNYAQQIPWQKGSRPHASNGWAYLKNTPFNLYKHSSHAGGVASPLIIHWPQKTTSTAGSILKQRLHVTDLYPTFLALAKQGYPTPTEDNQLKPLYGNSLLPLLEDSKLNAFAIHNQIFWSYRDISRAYVKDNWKIASIYDRPWSLFNVADDPAESQDIASAHPDIVKNLNDQWYDFANNHTSLAEHYKSPLHNKNIGWGFHRLKRVLPNLLSTFPLESQANVPIDIQIEMVFDGEIDFSNTTNKTIRLYTVSDIHTPIWQADLDSSHMGQGKDTLIINDLPKLSPDTGYFFLADRGWVKVNGKAAGPINDGAYWWRFRTAK